MGITLHDPVTGIIPEANERAGESLCYSRVEFTPPSGDLSVLMQEIADQKRCEEPKRNKEIVIKPG